MKTTILGVACAAALAACGGGGNSTDTSGVYQAYTAGGKHFPVTLNFTTSTYSFVVDGNTFAGTLDRAFETFTMRPNDQVAYTSLGGFTVGDNVIVGDLKLPGSNTDAFIAAKTFVTNLADMGVGSKFEVITRDTTGIAAVSSTPARWGVYRVNPALSTISYCGGTPTGVSAGAEPLSDSANCPVGTIPQMYSLAPTGAGGAFTQSVFGSTNTSLPTSEVRFAKVGSNFVYISGPSSNAAQTGTFSVGVSGARGDLLGTYLGDSSTGEGVDLVMGPSANAAKFMGGTAALPGSRSEAGNLAAEPSANNSVRFTPAGGLVPTRGLVVSPGLVVEGDFVNRTGNMTMFVRWGK